MKRWLWKLWHGVVIGTGTVLSAVCVGLLLPTLALLDYEMRTDWDA
jgi:hypothetical protein